MPSGAKSSGGVPLSRAPTRLISRMLCVPSDLLVPLKFGGAERESDYLRDSGELRNVAKSAAPLEQCAFAASALILSWAVLPVAVGHRRARHFGVLIHWRHVLNSPGRRSVGEHRMLTRETNRARI